MNPQLELMIFMTPIFADRAELALEVFKGVRSRFRGIFNEVARSETKSPG